MISERTVLVLGAACSSPYGFPLGSGLLHKIYESRRDVFYDSFGKAYRISPREIDACIDAMQKSGATSIDAFLGNRPDFLRVGKSLIAHTLIPLERDDLLFDHKVKENFYQYLFSHMQPAKRFEENKLSFITFNYDRSLEHYMFTALRHSLNESSDSIAERMAAIPIIHVHGNLGYLPWQLDRNGKPCRDYTSSPAGLFEDVVAAVENMNIISEDVLDESDNFKRAQSLMKDADQIHFLGFGYHAENMRRLNTPAPPKIVADGRTTSVPRQRITGGTAFGLTDAEIQSFHKKHASISLQLRPFSIVDYLRESVDFLRIVN